MSNKETGGMQSQPEVTRWLKPKEYAAKYQCHVKTACRWAHQLRVRSYTTGNRVHAIADEPPQDPSSLSQMKVQGGRTR